MTSSTRTILTHRLYEVKPSDGLGNEGAVRQPLSQFSPIYHSVGTIRFYAVACYFRQATAGASDIAPEAKDLTWRQSHLMNMVGAFVTITANEQTFSL